MFTVSKAVDRSSKTSITLSPLSIDPLSNNKNVALPFMSHDFLAVLKVRKYGLKTNSIFHVAILLKFCQL